MRFEKASQIFKLETFLRFLSLNNFQAYRQITLTSSLFPFEMMCYLDSPKRGEASLAWAMGRLLDPTLTYPTTLPEV